MEAVAIDLSQLMDTDIALTGKFSSPLITLGDLEAFARLMREIAEATESEARRTLGLDISLVSDVEVSGGSFRIKARLKAAGQKLTKLDQQAVAIVAASIIALAGGNVIVNVPPGQAPITISEPSYQCREQVEDAHRRFMDEAGKMPKGFHSEFEASCGPMSVKTVINRDK